MTKTGGHLKTKGWNRADSQEKSGQPEESGQSGNGRASPEEKRLSGVEDLTTVCAPGRPECCKSSLSGRLFTGPKQTGPGESFHSGKKQIKAEYKRIRKAFPILHKNHIMNFK